GKPRRVLLDTDFDTDHFFALLLFIHEFQSVLCLWMQQTRFQHMSSLRCLNRDKRRTRHSTASNPRKWPGTLGWIINST
ncbi:unnamed protein product, partial [Linum tenue]